MSHLFIVWKSICFERHGAKIGGFQRILQRVYLLFFDYNDRLPNLSAEE